MILIFPVVEKVQTVPPFIEDNINIVDMLVNYNICSSKREAREMVSGNAISINNKKINDLEYVVTRNIAIDKKVILIKKGKKNYYMGIYN